MKNLLQFFGQFPNGFVSKLSLVVCFVCLSVFVIIGIVQALKNRNGIYNFKTEWLSIVVAEVLYIFLYILWLTAFKQTFVFYELLLILQLAVFAGVFASVIAEKLFRQKK